MFVIILSKPETLIVMKFMVVDHMSVLVTQIHHKDHKVPPVLKVIMDQLVDPVVQVLKVSKVQPDLWEIPQMLQRVLKDRWALLEMLHFQE
jgi:hypothetical protein